VAVPCHAANDSRNQNSFWLGADLVVEIVSPDNVERDTVIKRAGVEVRVPPEKIQEVLDRDRTGT